MKTGTFIVVVETAEPTWRSIRGKLGGIFRNYLSNLRVLTAKTDAAVVGKILPAAQMKSHDLQLNRKDKRTEFGMNFKRLI